MSLLILIPARSGSTRVPNKNLVLVGDYPLIAWSIRAAKKVINSRILVSTNSTNIGQVAKSFGADVPFYRPEALSNDYSTSLSVILHAVDWYIKQEIRLPEYLAFKPPTCPFVSSETIEQMCEKLKSSENFNSIVTVTHASLHPFRAVQIDKMGKLRHDVVKINNQDINDFERTQDFPEVKEGSPACRMTKTSYFLNLLNKNNGKLELEGQTYDSRSSMAYEISKEESFDIDEAADLKLAQNIASNYIYEKNIGN